MSACRVLWLIPLVPALALYAGDKPAAKSPLLNSVARPSISAEVRQQFGLGSEYDNRPDVERLKVAVLDYGFDGVDSTRPFLPANTVLVEHYDPDFVRRHRLGDPDFRKAFAPGNKHGRVMAQIVWAVTGQNPRGPQFFFFAQCQRTDHAPAGRPVRHRAEGRRGPVQQHI